MQYPPSFDDGRPPFDHAVARQLVGKRVLIGMTFLDRRGEIKRQDQFFGVVVRADARHGIAVSLEGQRTGETKWLPPTTAPFLSAPQGEYKLRSTGEVVVNPDYTARWTVTQPDA